MAINVTEQLLNEGAEWGRPWTVGWQPAEVLSAEEYTSAKGSESVKVVFSVPGPEGNVKVDKYVGTSGAGLRHLLEALAPEYLAGGSFEPATIVGRRCEADIVDDQWPSGEGKPGVKALRPVTYDV